MTSALGAFAARELRTISNSMNWLAEPGAPVELYTNKFCSA